MNTATLATPYALLALTVILVLAFLIYQKLTTIAGQRGKPMSDTTIGIYSYDEAGHKKAKANPPVVKVGKNSVVVFVTDGCPLDFAPPSLPPNSRDLFPSLPQPSGPNQWRGNVGDKPGAYKYSVTCGGTPVEGNSPPVIIIDP
jgi:hypothetical protein